MATVVKKCLSGSTNGRGIKVAANATPGTTLHTATADAGAQNGHDEIWLKAYNSNTTTEVLTLEWGGTTNPDDNMKINIPAGATVWICEGLILQNSLVVKAFSTTANKVVIFGYVNNIST